MEPIIEIRQLSKIFGSGENQVAALQNVSLQIRSGEIVGIIGLSGAGKSTLVRCINLLEHPSEGSVLFHGKDLTHLKNRELRLQRRKISMIFQLNLPAPGRRQLVYVSFRFRTNLCFC